MWFSAHALPYLLVRRMEAIRSLLRFLRATLKSCCYFEVGAGSFLYLPFSTFPVLKSFYKSCDFCLRMSSSEGSGDHSFALLVHRYYFYAQHSGEYSTELHYATKFRAGYHSKSLIQWQCRSSGFDSGSRTIVSLIPDVLKQRKSGVITAQNFMLLVIQIRISYKPTWVAFPSFAATSLVQNAFCFIFIHLNEVKQHFRLLCYDANFNFASKHSILWKPFTSDFRSWHMYNNNNNNIRILYLNMIHFQYWIGSGHFGHKCVKVRYQIL